MIGKFIVIEGPDGVGKSTIIDGLKKELPDALFLRQPGSTKFGNEMRKILLHKDYKLEPMSEAMLFLASFIETSDKIIQPALDKGKLVISDRWYHSTLAYQGVNLDDAHFEMLQGFIEDLNDIKPNKTIILLAKKSVIESRRKERDLKKDNFESRDKKYLDKVYDYYKYHSYYITNTEVKEINVNGAIENNIKKVLKEIKKCELSYF